VRDIVLFIDVPDSGIAALYYQAARSLDLAPVLLTTSPRGGSEVGASDRLQVSKIELTTVLSAIERFGSERIAGVFGFKDRTAEFAARVAIALGRPHSNPDAISLCNDKHRLREFLARKNLNTVAYRHVAAVSDAAAAFASLGGAVVVKPKAAAGGDGVRVCRTADEAVLHARRLLKRQPDGVLFEKYIDAPQYSVEIFDGAPLSVKKTYSSEGPFPYMTGDDVPTPLSKECSAEIKDYARSIIRQVGLCDGPAVVELRCSAGEKYLIEINARPSYDGPMFMGIVNGVRLDRLCLQFFCGIPYEKELDTLTADRRSVAGRFVYRHGSSVKAIKGVEEARNVPGVVSVHVDPAGFYRRGPATNTRDRIVTIHAAAEDMEGAASSAELAAEKLTVVYDAFPMSFARYHFTKMHALRRKLSKTRSPTLRKSMGGPKP